MKKIIVLAVVLVLAGCNSIVIPSWVINSAVLKCQHHKGVSSMYKSGGHNHLWKLTCNDGALFNLNKVRVSDLQQEVTNQCSSE